MPKGKGTYGSKVGRPSKKKKYQKGGKLKGKSHAKGGKIIEVEGGEYVIKKSSVNKQTEAYLDYINTHGKLPPSFNAKKRRK